jgi:hypothetical protein
MRLARRIRLRDSERSIDLEAIERRFRGDSDGKSEANAGRRRGEIQSAPFNDAGGEIVLFVVTAAALRVRSP